MDDPIEIAGEAGPLAWLVDPRDPEVHLDVLGRPGFIVPVIGSGITAPLGYPSGGVLRERLVAIGTEAHVELEGLTHSDPRRVAGVLVERGVLARGGRL